MRFAIVFLLISSTAFPDDGAILFKNKCSMCHQAGSGTRAPLTEVLRRMSRQSILTALETGRMKPQAAGLSQEQLEAIANYLGMPDQPALATRSGECVGDPPPMSRAPGWVGWGGDIANTRFQPANVA